MDPQLFTTFAAIERTHWWFTARRDILLSVSQRYVPSGGSVLDVGCGTGFFIESMRGRYDAWGVDPSDIAVRLCRERGLTQVVQGSAYDLSSLQGRRFDAVYFLDVLEHLPEDLPAVEEAIRVLKPGGHVIVTVPAFMFLWSEHDVVNEHQRRYRRAEVRTLLERAGLAIQRLTYFNFYLFGLAGADRLATRISGRRVSRELTVPPSWINSLMNGTFRAERHRVADGRRLPYPFGLSVLAVGRKPER